MTPSDHDRGTEPAPQRRQRAGVIGGGVVALVALPVALSLPIATPHHTPMHLAADLAAAEPAGLPPTGGASSLVCRSAHLALYAGFTSPDIPSTANFAVQAQGKGPAASSGTVFATVDWSNSSTGAHGRATGRGNVAHQFTIAGVRTGIGRISVTARATVKGRHGLVSLRDQCSGTI
ncbi:hypothetical protein P0W64_17445 [Tsukamurella sp. 8F]|uniref:hypothetical protein n=1 Tax=unclassified Tsukamurella TaxID=2633480 RepID=UPI0023B8EA62|nr:MULTISPECIES: hypothetical protein [unclassified Tsukamurella]MDF0531364.1 hypothetical protein [Tsukamurella sp. 8J]MDF0588570.1 hypothetical protein [Tsukamurella sp. 8F]